MSDSDPSTVGDHPAEDVRVLTDLTVTMRDGTELSADVFLPEYADDGGGESDSFPTLVLRTPYDKTEFREDAEPFARHGYAVVVQDVRGRFESNGEFETLVNEAEDSYDTVEWAAARDWSNGRVGTFGISYMAATQWHLAQLDELPPHLESMAPGQIHSNLYTQVVYPGGAFMLAERVTWEHQRALSRQDDGADGQTSLERAFEALPQLLWDLPVDPYEPLLEVGYTNLQEDFANETYSDEAWGRTDVTDHYDEVDIPVLNYGGWYDTFADATPIHHQGIREAGTRRAREEATLVMGPWSHATMDSREQGMVWGSLHQFPENSTLDEEALLLSWFDRTLKGDGDSSSDPPVRLYVPGLDEWVGGTDFPLPATEWTEFYLHSEGAANVGNITDTNYEYEGRLSTEKSGEEPPDTYTYDPSDPVITVGGNHGFWRSGVADVATSYGVHDDILVYQTDVLEEDVAVVGPITATLYASTSAVDTDFVVRLSDVGVGEAGSALYVAEGARRGRVGDVSADPRDKATYTHVEPLEPGEVYEWQIALNATARVFEAGRRIRIDVTSSNFPRYNRNLNTGEGLTGEEMVDAEQTIYHDAERPSHVRLPLVPVDELADMTIEGPVPDHPNAGILHD